MILIISEDVTEQLPCLHAPRGCTLHQWSQPVTKAANREGLASIVNDNSTRLMRAMGHEPLATTLNIQSFGR